MYRVRARQTPHPHPELGGGPIVLVIDPAALRVGMVNAKASSASRSCHSDRGRAVGGSKLLVLRWGLN